MTDKGVGYKGYIIKPKRDFPSYGFLINGKRVRKGYVVVDKRNVNVMPAATWFQTIEKAKKGIDVFIKYGEKNFWKGRKAEGKEMSKKLEIKLEELQKKHAELDAQYKNAEANIKGTEEWKALQKRKKINGINYDLLEKKIDAKQNKIREKFLDKNDFPYYSRTGYGGISGEYTNIKDCVLLAIRDNLSISKLRGSDIEEIARSLIKREQIRTGADKLDQKLTILRKEWKDIITEEENFETEEMKNIKLERSHICREKQAIENRIKNPKECERKDDREAERAKVNQKDVLDAIEKDVREYRKLCDKED